MDEWTTKLSPEQEKAYQEWRASLPPHLQNEDDYDLRGAFIEGAGTDERAHMTDKFKKPNHITFSDGSQYSTPTAQGGQWVDAGNGSWNFWASPENLKRYSMTALAKYFQTYEPNNHVFMQSGYKLPPGGR